MYKYLLLFLLTCLVGSSLQAQSEKLGFGFRAGASYAKITGPSELGPAGENLESMTNKSGFHIGATISYKATDLFGIRGEFVYSQRGSILDYNGPSYYVLGRRTLLESKVTGTRNQSLKVNNTYLDLPVMVYYKLGFLELSGGINSSLLLSSTGGGSTGFDDAKSSNHAAVDTFSVRLEHNYKSDKAEEALAETFLIMVDGFNVTQPSRVGAYYEYDTKDKNLFKTLDFGLVACASIYINSGLYVSARYIHGLTDVDRNDYDVSLQSLNSDGTFIQRADVNKSKAWQFSVGFSF